MKMVTLIFLSAAPSPVFGPNILFTALFSHIQSSRHVREQLSYPYGTVGIVILVLTS
jgi:hypothetical protein